ncbi:MAG: isochorismatase family protein [Gemmatales bacterium]|nr:isochorismatase family protein [Gemmatales bacterium]MCS7159141.1 isochorismatase family protein [Gemmatales bacterium]MDW8174341.1 isochorismatase family protein [Gemmatales bacterium]MDW8221433.1 isochorismatase family protein [Gemmatales bacterium]
MSRDIDFRKSALIVVDVQCGFSELCPQELPVPGALGIVPAINRLLALDWERIDATQDWHPPDHCSFLGQRDNLYPPHCVQGTRGAEFLPGLWTQRFHTIWRKGYLRDRDAYALTAQHPAYPALLHAAHVDTVVVCGLAKNICVFYTARDLSQAGFRVIIADDASAGVDVPAAGLYQEQARSDAQKMGILYLSSEEISAAAARL